MRILRVEKRVDNVLSVVADDARVGNFDVAPYLGYEAFAERSDHDEFIRVGDGGYFVKWACGADLSADTIEAQWDVVAVASPI